MPDDLKQPVPLESAIGKEVRLVSMDAGRRPERQEP
jgi:hypothetical protein